MRIGDHADRQRANTSGHRLCKKCSQEGVREQSHRQRSLTIPAREALKQKTPGWLRTMRAIPCEPAQSAEPQQQEAILTAVTFT